MAIERSIETRLAQRVWELFSVDADYAPLCGAIGVVGDPDYAPPRIYMGSWFDSANQQLSGGDELRIYPGSFSKHATSAGPTWDVEPQVIVEYFLPRSTEQPFGVAPGDVTAHDKAKGVLNRLVCGESDAKAAGQFRDPDDVTGATWLTNAVLHAVIEPPVVSTKDAAILYFISATYAAREDKRGRRL